MKPSSEETAMLLEAEADGLLEAAIRLRRQASELRGGAARPEANGDRTGLSPRAEVRLARAREQARQRAAAIYMAFKELQDRPVELLE